MLKTITTAIALALAGVVLIAATALGWHVNVDKDKQQTWVTEPRAVAKDPGPRGDPLYRFIVKVIPGKRMFGPCTGTVSVPDARWAQGTTFTVDGTNVALTRGQTSRSLPAGAYVGRWSNSEEVERFTISCDRAFVPAVEQVQNVPITTHARYTGKGYQKRCFVVPVVVGGDKRVLKTPWMDLKPNTKYAVILHKKGKNIRGRVAPLGWYQDPWMGFTPNAWKFRVN